MKTTMKHPLATLAAALASAIILPGCATRITIPEIKNFDQQRYMGTWYEIARLDHPFERGLENVSATYTLRKDGKIAILNKGYNPAQNTWKQSTATAIGQNKPNHLKVYFIPLIGGNYQIAAIDRHYTQAIVSGGTDKYLWLLSRTPTITEKQRNRMMQTARKLGYDTSKLIIVRQTEQRKTQHPRPKPRHIKQQTPP